MPKLIDLGSNALALKLAREAAVKRDGYEDEKVAFARMAARMLVAEVKKGMQKEEV